MVSGALFLAAYCIYAFGFQAGRLAADDFRFWAGTMLIFIGIGIAAMIIIQIIFHIILAVSVAVKETVVNGKSDNKEIDRSIKVSMTEDEMDKLIHLKSLRLGFIFAGVGFIAALISLVCGSPVAVMLNIIFLSCFTGTLAEGFLSLHYYKKGVSNG